MPKTLPGWGDRTENKTEISALLELNDAHEKNAESRTAFPAGVEITSPEEAQLWSEAFDELLASKYGLAAFRAFLKSEFCEENIELKLSSKAKKIYTDFIERLSNQKSCPKHTGGYQWLLHKCPEKGVQLDGEEFYQDLCKKPQITTEPHAT
ncbi:regulator of G-protein signaling 2-like [Bos javanicus]|uniref:regulator of G-protein signaling 2-like n=1 Tax=Bos javanicus TaxID=9906 RepID=UPI002AA78687|nr:regulator of G-protein signaling 2-like [Bos javanicus]